MAETARREPLRQRWIAGMLVAETLNGTVTIRRPSLGWLEHHTMPRIRGRRDPGDDPVPGITCITRLWPCGAVESQAIWPKDAS